MITLSEYIKKLQQIEAQVGGDVPVITWVDEYDGCGAFYTSPLEPDVYIPDTNNYQDDWLLDDLSDVPDNGWFGKYSSDIEKSENKIHFDKAVIL